MCKGLWQKSNFATAPFLYHAIRDWIRLFYSSISLSSGYPASMYALFAPLGIINLRLFGVLQNILSEPEIFGGLFPLNITLVKRLHSLKA